MHRDECTYCSDWRFNREIHQHSRVADECIVECSTLTATTTQILISHDHSQSSDEEKGQDSQATSVS